MKKSLAFDGTVLRDATVALRLQVARPFTYGNRIRAPILIPTSEFVPCQWPAHLMLTAFAFDLPSS
jgi:hypothetical protein